ncbi:hypothetical protein QP411_08590, partial [Pseudoglutamicibacter cumminsii]|uniref:hypothetical protein n=1 Tax=Pseudoglutamicibacter cumminsii TaxID=156979 RepID=UPI002556D1C9
HQTKKYLVSTNKLGTLLSSQTTDTQPARCSDLQSAPKGALNTDQFLGLVSVGWSPQCSHDLFRSEPFAATRENITAVPNIVQIGGKPLMDRKIAS